jgi:hypothetical protein
MDHQYQRAAGFAEDLMKRGVCQFGVEMLLVCKENFKFSLGIFKSPPLAKISCLQFQ